MFDGLDNLLEILLLAEVFDTPEGEVRHEILPVAEVSDAVKGRQHRLFEFEELVGSLLHAEPEHPRGVACSEDAGTVEVDRETLLILKHFRDGLDNFRFILRWSFANELKGQMDVGRLHPVDHFLVRQTPPQIVDQRCEAVVFGLNRYC